MERFFSTQVCCGSTFTSSANEDCRFQSKLRAGSSRDRQVRANETAVGGLISTKLSMTGLTSSSISTIGCGMSGRWGAGGGGVTEVPVY